jgi:uncharacterized protein YdbL (DUF1318 family)
MKLLLRVGLGLGLMVGPFVPLHASLASVMVQSTPLQQCTDAAKTQGLQGDQASAYITSCVAKAKAAAKSGDTTQQSQ